MNKSLIALFLVSMGFMAFGQDQQERLGRPDVPGMLLLEYGIAVSTGDALPTKLLGTRTFNIYYLQDLKLGSSNFSFHPGIGVGFDRYGFDLDSLNRPITIVDLADSSSFVNIEGLNVKRSMMKTAYLDIPVEFRWNSNPSDPGRTFTIAVGAKVGLRLQGKSKYVYNVDTEVHKIKEIHPFHLSRVRYGAYLRVGGGGINAFVNYMISPVFNSGEGHLNWETNMVQTGISFNLF